MRVTGADHVIRVRQPSEKQKESQANNRCTLQALLTFDCLWSDRDNKRGAESLRLHVDTAN